MLQSAVFLHSKSFPFYTVVQFIAFQLISHCFSFFSQFGRRSCEVATKIRIPFFTIKICIHWTEIYLQNPTKGLTNEGCPGFRSKPFKAEASCLSMLLMWCCALVYEIWIEESSRFTGWSSNFRQKDSNNSPMTWFQFHILGLETRQHFMTTTLPRFAYAVSSGGSVALT